MGKNKSSYDNIVLNDRCLAKASNREQMTIANSFGNIRQREEAERLKFEAKRAHDAEIEEKKRIEREKEKAKYIAEQEKRRQEEEIRRQEQQAQEEQRRQLEEEAKIRYKARMQELAEMRAQQKYERKMEARASITNMLASLENQRIENAESSII